jgi:hypothetical protein
MYDSDRTPKAVFVEPDKNREQSIKEIFNLTKTDLPKHLEPLPNPLEAWGNKKR